MSTVRVDRIYQLITYSVVVDTTMVFVIVNCIEMSNSSNYSQMTTDIPIKHCTTTITKDMAIVVVTIGSTTVNLLID